MKKKILVTIFLFAMLTIFGFGCSQEQQNNNTPLVESIQTESVEKIKDIQENEIVTTTITNLNRTTTTTKLKIEEKKETTETKKIIIKPETSIKTEEIKKEITTTTTNIETIICTSMDCFIELTKTCTKSKLIDNIISQLPVEKDIYYTKTTKNIFKIEKADNNLCNVTVQPLSVLITISDEMKTKSLEKGFTEEDINWDLNMVNEVYNEPMQLNYIISCVGTADNMSFYFTENQQVNNKNCYNTNSEIICNHNGITCTISDIR